MPLEPGQALAHYRIERQIGQGGMGEVYLAEDIRLDRKVALKVLRPGVASNTDRLERFRREAKAVATLNHPHIVTIYSVEEEAGTHFLTMELVEGQSLDHVIPPGGLPFVKMFDVGIALADALVAAHEKGIVHRDLKPANVMVTKDGRVKVLDFGLAKLAGTERGNDVPAKAPLSSAPTEPVEPAVSLTSAGMVMGTVPYMSPEQVSGDSVDARTDIFALGVVLYEMATGRRPFQGKNNAETMSSILRDTPRMVSDARPDAPRHLTRIIDHCLQKSPNERFQTAKDVRSELRVLQKEVESDWSRAGGIRTLASAPAIAGPGPPPRLASKGVWVGLAGALATIVALALVLIRTAQGPGENAPARPAPGTAASAAAEPDAKSIAVLPFEDMSQDKNQQYFSDGISEELLNLLTKIPELRVAARTSSFSFKGKGVEVPEIARQLHVAHLLEGSVRKAGDRVRITAQLIHAADGFHIWSQTYDRKFGDIFAIQDEIAAEVVKELKISLLGAVPKARTTDPEAYALYLQAVQIGRQTTPEGFERSDALLRRVLKIDPRYAPAWTALAASFTNQAAIGLVPAEAGYAKAREAATKALGIDPGFAPAYSALAWIAMYGENDLAGAARYLERALALDPTDPRVLNSSAGLLALLGRVDEALALQEAIARRDPLNVTLLANLGISQLDAGRYDEAIDSFRTVLSLSPGRGVAHCDIGLALLRKGDAPGALAEIEQETSGDWRAIALPIVYHALGRDADSDAALAALIADYSQDNALNIARVYAFRGEVDPAFEWLNNAVQKGEAGLSDVDSLGLFTNIKKDPRWLPFLRKIGSAPEQLAKIQFKVKLPD